MLPCGTSVQIVELGVSVGNRSVHNPGVDEAESHQVFLQVPAERISALSTIGDAAALVDGSIDLSFTGWRWTYYIILVSALDLCPRLTTIISVNLPSGRQAQGGVRAWGDTRSSNK